MKKLIPILAIVILLAASCKKNTGDFMPAPLHPGNEIKATISLAWNGSGATPYEITGNNVGFIRDVYPNGDSVIRIFGGAIDITLVNVNATGTYTVGTSGTQYIGLTYIDGCLYTCPIYEIYPARTGAIITIETLTSTYIKGSFAATCTGLKGTVQITNGSLKGNF